MQRRCLQDGSVPHDDLFRTDRCMIGSRQLLGSHVPYHCKQAQQKQLQTAAAAGVLLYVCSCCCAVSLVACQQWVEAYGNRGCNSVLRG